MAVDMDTVYPLLKPGEQSFSQPKAPLRDLIALLAGQSVRLGQAHNSGHVLGARAALALLPAAHALRLEGCPSANIEESYALGTVELVGGEAQEVNAEVSHVDFQQAGRLDRVRVDGDCPPPSLGLFFYEPCDLLDWLYRADLVVRHHDAYEYRLVGDGGGDLVGGYQAVSVHRKVGDVEAELLQLMTGVQHRVVLDVRRYYVVSDVLEGEGDALQRSVVGLRAAAGEDDLAHPGAQ